MKELRCFIIFLLAHCLFKPVFAQQQLFRSYTVSQGLPNNSIRNIYQDSKGFIWIGTWEGLSKYDGHRFINFTENNGLPHNMINDLVETGEGKMMVAMNNGSTSIIDHDKVIQPALFSGIIINNFFQGHENKMLAVTDNNGFFSIEKNKLNKITAAETYSIYNAIKTRKGFYVAVGDKYPLAVYNKDFKKIFQVVSPAFLSEEVMEDLWGRIWIGSETGLKLLNYVPGKREGFELSSLTGSFDDASLKSKKVSAIFQDDDSSLWFGTDAGLLKIEQDGTKQLYTEKDGLPSNRIRCIMQDREKNLWVGTTAGLAKMANQSVRIVNLPGLSSELTTFFGLYPVTKSSFILITSEGVYTYNISSGQHKLLLRMSAIPILQSHPFRLISGLTHFEYDSIADRLIPLGKLNSEYNNFCAAEKNNILALGFIDGIRFYNKGKITHILNNTRIHSLYWDQKGRLWVGSWNNGLFRIQFDTIQNKVIQIEDLSAAGSKFIRTILEDHKGNMWVGTRYNGLVIFTPGDKGDSVKILNQKDGIQSNWIYSIGQDNDGSIWAGTLSGINKIIETQNGYRVFNFSRVFNFFSTVSSIAGFPGNQIWCTSDKGLLALTDHHLENQSAWTVQFTNIELGKNEHNYAYSSTSEPVSLRYRQNFSRFEFTSTGFVNEAELLYSYRLAGSHDTSWTAPANIHSVQYASLEPGNYRFEVRMLGWNGIFGPVSQFPFHIASPYWQTWWFYLGLFLIAAFLFYLIYRYRVKQLLRVQQVRNNIATDLHDEIGSTLTNISILSQLSMNNLDQPVQAREFLGRIRDEIETSGQALDDIIWSVNSRNDSLSETMARMRRFAGDLFDNSPTQCVLEIEEKAGDKKINMEQRRDLYLIYKEALVNIHKHAKAHNARIRVSFSDNTVKLEIEDDGQGFQPEQETHRNGIKNLKLRVAKWNGKFNIDSGKNQGTRITMNMPVKEI